MSFQSKFLDEVPDVLRGVKPDVQIFFQGQLLLRAPGEGRTCEVAVNPLATNHAITIEARTKVTGKPDTIKMRHVGPLAFRRDGRAGMLIEVINPSAANPAAFKCTQRGVATVDYTSGASIPSDEDFRWILDLESSQFHGQVLNVPIFDSHHVISLRGGEYYFRTATRADARTVHKRVGGGKDPVTFRRIGVIASASVFFAPDQENHAVRMTWQSPTRSGDATVTLNKAANTTHEIYINNTPLFLDSARELADPESGELLEFEELKDCYKLVTGVLTPNQFKLIPTLLRDGSEPGQEGSPDIPCQIHRLDEGNI
jgi:hypothetical protein